MALAFPTPPLDGAGGRLVIGVYNPGIASFRVGVHIPLFADTPTATTVTGGTPTDWTYDSPPGVAVAGSSLEGSVGQTAIDLIDAIKPLYDANFKFRPVALYRLVQVTLGGRVTTQAVQVFPVPAVGPVDGTFDAFSVAAGSPSRLVTSWYSGRSRGNASDAANPHSGRRFRIGLRAIPGRAAGWFIPVTAAGGGYNQPYAETSLGTANLDQSAQDQALAGYLSQQTAINGFTGVVLAHDGTVPYDQFNIETNTTKRAIRALKLAM